MLNNLQQLPSEQRIKLAGLAFVLAGSTLMWWRLMTLHASYDQGIFLQILWNGLHGHPFQSTLSSQLSTNVIHSGEFPALGYHRLSQHFTPILVLWIPLVGILGIWALPFLQVALVGAAGFVLYKLARLDLSEQLSERITLAFWCANAVIAPTLSNFTDLCQLPLLVFLLLFGIRTQRNWLVLISSLLIPMIREDTGVVLASIGVWLAIRQPHKKPWAFGMIAFGLGWVALVTNVLMPIFGDDNARRFMVSNFGQFAPETERATSAEILLNLLQKPLTILHELISPPGDTIFYLLGQGLPLLFIPLIASDAWLLMGLPLLGLLLARGSNDPLSINIRYTFLVVPGLFAGSILWWRKHQSLYSRKRLRQIWTGCILLSLIIAIVSNQNRTFSFLIPESIQPWVYATPLQQWQHGQAARKALNTIPSKATVSANTNLVPWLANREVLIRFPHDVHYQDRENASHPVDWVAIDLNNMAYFAPAFKRDRSMLRKSIKWLDKNSTEYAVQSIQDGVVVLERFGKHHASLDQQLKGLRMSLEHKTMPPNQRQKPAD